MRTANLAILILVVACSARAATTANIIIVPDAAAQGILTLTSLSNIVIGDHKSLSYVQDGGPATTWQRTYIGPAKGPGAFQSPITVGGISYDGSSTSNWIRFDSGTNLTSERMRIEFVGGPGSTVTNALMGGLRAYYLTNSTLSDMNLDTFIFYDNSGGAWAVAQLVVKQSNGSIGFRSHAAGAGGASTFGPLITIAEGKIYFVVLYRDPIGGRACVRVYDPDTWSLVGESISGLSPGNTYLIDIPVGYIGNPPLDAYMGPTFVIFDADNTTYTNLISQPAQPIVTLGKSTIGKATFGQ